MRALGFWLILGLTIPFGLPAVAGVDAFDPANPAGSGYRQVLNEEFRYDGTGFIDFTGRDAGKLWHSGLWHQGQRIPDASLFHIADGVLTIKDSGEAGIGTNLCTSTAQNPTRLGRAFMGGYFEIRVLAHNWGGGGLYSLAWQQGDVAAVKAYGGAAEIDLLETDEGYPDFAFTTAHTNSLARQFGFGADIMSAQHANPIANPPMIGQWHTVGVRWTRDDVTWYVDARMVAKAAALPPLWQKMTFCLWASPGGVNGGPSREPAEVRFKWVRVWQRPTIDH